MKLLDDRTFMVLYMCITSGWNKIICLLNSRSLISRYLDLRMWKITVWKQASFVKEYLFYALPNSIININLEEGRGSFQDFFTLLVVGESLLTYFFEFMVRDVGLLPLPT